MITEIRHGYWTDATSGDCQNNWATTSDGDWWGARYLTPSVTELAYLALSPCVITQRAKASLLRMSLHLYRDHRLLERTDQRYQAVRSLHKRARRLNPPLIPSKNHSQRPSTMSH